MSDKMSEEEVAVLAHAMHVAAQADDPPCLAAFKREDRALHAAFVRVLTAPTRSLAYPQFGMDWADLEHALRDVLHAARSRHLAKHQAMIEAERYPMPIKAPVPR